ncbi:MAG: PD40 domain-containing protein [Planctomycetes bacterium]|nr:PD40 domain-containing protein [Planctomycetota bacterium]
MLAAAPLLATAAMAQVTQCISVTPGPSGLPGHGSHPLLGRHVSADGRFVLFQGGPQLAGGTALSYWQTLLRDRLLGTTEAISVDDAGVMKGGYGFMAMSPDGRYVAFDSYATDLVPGDVNGTGDCFLRDRQSHTTELVSLGSSGGQGDAISQAPVISDDGRFVAFNSNASNLVAGDTNGNWDIFVRDRLLGTTERISVSTAGLQGDGDSFNPCISADGNRVLFFSSATTLVPGDTNGAQDVFLHDRSTGTTERVSVSSTGAEGDAESYESALTANGRYAVFTSSASNFIPGVVPAAAQIYLRDLVHGTTVLVSATPAGLPGSTPSRMATVSANGKLVAFWCGSTDILPGLPPNTTCICTRDMTQGTSINASLTTMGTSPSGGASWPSISDDGRFVVFGSGSSDIVPGDTNNLEDVFIRDLRATGFTSLCSPGQGNVIACPCGNPPSGPGRGCDNSSSTGGAILSATGTAYLSQDTLVFTSTNEKPNATSLLLQGTTVLPTGAAFGQGVRCAGGTLKRLYVKTAVGGAITAPDLPAGDASVSARSAQLGVPIDCGVPHAYFVYYRDPIVLGNCPASSTFNTTQTGSIQWWP